MKEFCKLHQLVDIVVFQETAPTAIGIYPAFGVYVCLAFLTKYFYDGPISGVCHLCEFKITLASSRLAIYANINKLEQDPAAAVPENRCEHGHGIKFNKVLWDS